MLTVNDRHQLAEKGISEAQFTAQLARFKTGFPFLALSGIASTERGIFVPSVQDEETALAAWQRYLANPAHSVVKFVPASGAASRMFKDLYAFLDADYDQPTTKAERTFFAQVQSAAFYADLDAACSRLYGATAASLQAAGRYKDIVRALLLPEGLAYGSLPKGLLKFHTYPDAPRTAAEEHLVEAALYGKGADGKARIHFTVSPQHRALFEQLVQTRTVALESSMNATFEVGFSEQKSHTDTLAATADNAPFRTNEGALLFRPGGHGALIENLNDIRADIVFVKNIDNVVPDALKAETTHYKQVLAGILVTEQQRAFDYLLLLESGRYTPKDLAEINEWLETNFCTTQPEPLEGQALALYLMKKLNRPMRVCGMVKNVGEPGGGPFLAVGPDGTTAPQILESVQIDTTDPEKKRLFEQGTHFNPVDLVCAVRNFKGDHFDLTQFTDPDTGFISQKSQDGRALKALELPGLWNGAMSNWLTRFVEVPLSTFNPVKTVNDLFRDEHMGAS